MTPWPNQRLITPGSYFKLSAAEMKGSGVDKMPKSDIPVNLQFVADRRPRTERLEPGTSHIDVSLAPP